MDDDEIVDAEIVDEAGTELVPVGSGVESAAPPALDPVLELRKGLMALDEQRQALAEAGDYESLAVGAADIAAITGDLRDIERAARSDIATIVLASWVDERGERKRGKPKVTVTGLGVVEIEGGWERKNWQSEKLLRELMLRAIVDPDTGELAAESPMEIVGAIYEVLNECLPITGSLGWRTGKFDKATQELTGLKKFGIDDAEWCERVDKPVLAKVPKRQGST